MGRPKLELHHVEESSNYQIHFNTELEGCRKVKSEEFEIGGAKIVFLPTIDVFGKSVLLAPLVMGRPKLYLDHAEEVLNLLMLVCFLLLSNFSDVCFFIQQVRTFSPFQFEHEAFRFYFWFYFGNTILLFVLWRKCLFLLSDVNVCFSI